MDTIRTARLDDYAKMMLSTVQAYTKQAKLKITVATLPGGTVDWPTTLGSDPNVSEDAKDKLKAIQAGAWSKVNIDGGKDGKPLKLARKHAIACGSSAQFLSDLKGCAPA